LGYTPDEDFKSSVLVYRQRREPNWLFALAVTSTRTLGLLRFTDTIRAPGPAFFAAQTASWIISILLRG